MNGFGCEWRLEKSENIIQGICFMLKNTKEIKSNYQNAPDDCQEDIKSNFFSLLYDATKIFCDALQEYNNQTMFWFPELVEDFYKNPQKADEILDLLKQQKYKIQNIEEGLVK
jgi:hypothetical protein